MSNILAFPTGGRPASNVRELHNASFEYRGARGYQRSERPTMQTVVYRSYDLIVASSEADLIRDVQYDPAMAARKLSKIRQQIGRDREHAAAREALLTKAAAKLAAALAAVEGRAMAKKSRRPSRAVSLQLRERRNSPAGRLDAAGASKAPLIARRILWLSQHWHLPPCPKVGRAMTPELVDYCQTYGVSLNWAAVRRPQGPSTDDLRAQSAALYDGHDSA